MTSTLKPSAGVGNASRALDTSVERERLLALASDILQGQSAVFLLIQAARAPDLDRLEFALRRVRDWIEEFGSAAADFRRSDPHSEIASTVLFTRMNKAQIVLQRFGPFLGGPFTGVSACQVSGAIAASQRQLNRARQNSETFESIIGSCCAADVSDIARGRDQ